MITIEKTLLFFLLFFWLLSQVKKIQNTKEIIIPIIAQISLPPKNEHGARAAEEAQLEVTAETW